jgi:hypothetical protein
VEKVLAKNRAQMIDAGIEALNSEEYLYSIAFYRVDALRLFASFII